MVHDDIINDILKYEIADELGLMNKVRSGGWKSLSAKESGRIGGIMARRRKRMADSAAENVSKEGDNRGLL
ncbi:MAG: alpha/beta-type small acid-soluble spore protein [Defluviitaleaceae bacterium]|nr:alpha/beta-type small acid-soluble spore protein [Defluviitaleaceae bacterium]